MKFIKRDKTKGSLTNDIREASGIVSNNSSGNSSTTLESHRIWGQLFDGTNDVTGDMQNVGSITATGNIQTDESVIIKQLDADGNEVEGGDLTISVEDKKAKFSGKDQYVFDRAIEGTDIKANGNLNVTGASTMNGVTVNGDAAFNKNIEVKGQSNLTNVTSTNITNSDTIKTKNLEVTGSAHFFELIIDKIKAAGGAVLFTPANGFKVDIVESVTDGYKLYWQADDGSGNQADNMWKVNDQALCMSFNQAKEGTNHNISNKYYWSLVTAVSDTPVNIEEKKYHYIVISTVTKDGTVNPEIGDTIAMLGYRGTDDKKRQSAIYISAYTSLDKGLTAPLLAQYQGINDFNLESHRKSYFDAVSAKFVGNFEVSNGQTIEDYINNKITDSVASIKLDTKNIVLSVSEKTKERRNLLKGTTFHRQLDNFTISSTARIEMNSGYNGTNCIKVIDDTDGTSHYIGVYWDGSQGGRSVKIEKGKKYTISCYYKTNDRNAKFALEAIYTNKETNAERLGRPKYLSPSYFNPKYNQWELFTTVIDTTDAESDYIAFNFWEYCNVNAGRINAYICRPMVEEGDTYYGWTLSYKDNDYVGANLIDNSRTFQVGGNTLEAIGTKTLKGDVYELTYRGSAQYNTFYRIDSSNFKLDTDYTLSFDVRGDAKLIGVHAYYPMTKTPYMLLNEAMGKQMYEQSGDGNSEEWTTLLTNDDIKKEKKIWVHFKFMKRLPRYIYFQFPNNSDQSGVTSWTVSITKPKIEEGANVTEWTEKKTDVENSITTITNNVATLTQKANSIESNVTSNTTTINNINGQVTTNKTDIANLTIKADSIESTVSNMTKSNGTNLFSFTNTDFQNYWCRSAIQMNGFFTLKLNQGIYRLQNLGTENEGGDFVVSFDARVLKNTTVNVNFCDIGAEENHGDIALTTAFQHYVLHFKNIQSDYLNKALYNGFIDFEPKTPDETNQLYVANFMLERGTIPSEKFSISEADRNNYGNDNSFKDWEKDPRVQIVNETINGNSVQAYKVEGVPSGETFVDMLRGNNLQNKMKIQPQKVYTLSFWAKASESGHGINCYLWSDISDIGLNGVIYKGINGAGTQEQKTSSEDGSTLCELDSTWRKFYIQWHPHKVGDTINCNVGRLYYNMTVWLSDVKLEEGYICDENLTNQETYSSIKQTANEILMSVDNTYLKIGDGNITLNGDTKVNGSLTLNDEKQGFLLVGNGGTTEISPNSIGTYNEFASKTTNVIKTHYDSKIYGYKAEDGNYYRFSWTVLQRLGTFKKGTYIKILNYTNSAYAIGATSHISTPYATFYIYENGTTTKTINLGNKTSVDIANYTVVGDNVDVIVDGHFTIGVPTSIWGANGNPHPAISVSVNWINEVPKALSTFMLIGYDGFAANFGTNTTVYCGKDGFIANYGDSLFKITPDGIVEKRNKASIKVIDGSTSSSNPYIYEVPDTVDTILCKTGNTIIKLPSKPYQGQRVKIHDKSPNGETWINFQGYMVRANETYNNRRYQSKFPCDAQYVRIYTFIGDTWFEEFTG